MKNLIKTTKKALILSTASFFTLVAAASAYQVTNEDSEAAYLIQGATKATMTSLVKKVGGEVLHDFSAIQAISAELSEEQVNELNKISPLLRLSNKEQTAGYVWGRTRRTELAGYVWGRTRRTELAGYVWGRTRRVELAGYVWGRTRRVA